MSKGKITKRSVDALRCQPGEGRAILWDSALRGFGVIAYPSQAGSQGKRSYYAKCQRKGRPKWVHLGDHGAITPDQARDLAGQTLAALKRGEDIVAQRRADRAAKTFSEVAEDYFRLEVTPKRKPRTAEEYRRLLDLHLAGPLGSKVMADIRKADITRLHAKLHATPGAANRALTLFTAVWNWAAERDEAPSSANPARGIERYAEKARERYLSTQELARLGDALKQAETVGLPWDVAEDTATAKHTPKLNRVTKLDVHAVAALRLLILTGARLREILHAKWDYVDWDRGLLHLPDSKTGKKTIYLPAPAVAVLEALPRDDGSPYIIPGMRQVATNKGARREPKAKPRADLKKPWAAVSRAAGLEGVRLHDLRHSFAAIGAGASLGLPMIGKLLGHSQPSTTARYAHLDADPMRRAADMIGNQLAAAMAGTTAQVAAFKSRHR